MRRTLATAIVLFTASLGAACTTSEVLEPSAMVGPPPSAAAAASGLPAGIGDAAPEVPAAIPGAESATATPAAPLSQQPATAPVAALDTGEKIQIAPIVGSTVEAVTPLTERLALKARERGIGLAGSGASPATHVLKGYFSASTDGGKTTVYYVWDVLDPSGNRLHRIQGQETVDDAKGEGWASVPRLTMQTIADTTVDQLASWLAGNTG